uniref:Uncharacterized protein n=1 Tax=Tanacetum cinerariifolium TaxID=118510 RepID=A0A699ITW7_TANCI|nr:hypothetical protein [Tanacetum cinerariifolium]
MYTTADDPYDTESEIKFIKRFQLLDSLILEKDSNLASIPDDEVGSPSDSQSSETEADDNQSQTKELSKSEKRDADTLIDELTGLKAFADKPSNPLGLIQSEITSLSIKVDQLESNITKKVSDELQTSVPSLVSTALKETLPGLLVDALKDVLPSIIHESVKTTVQKSIGEQTLIFQAQVHQTLVDQLNTMIYKPMNKQFHAFNKLESRRFVHLQKELSKGEQESNKTPEDETAEQLSTGTMVIHTSEVKGSEEKVSKEKTSDNEPPTKRLKVLIPIPTPLRSILPDPPSIQREEAQALELVEYAAKKAKMLAEYNHYLTFRADPRKITKINYKIDIVTKKATMRLKRNNQPLSLTVMEKFGLKQLGFTEWVEIHDLASKGKSKATDTLLRNLKAKFEWVKTQARKLSLSPPPELTAEVFVNENIRVDGMERNLIPPQGVIGSPGLVITEPEAGIFYYNGNFDLVFQRENEFHLATTAQLIRQLDHIKKDTPEGKEMIKKVQLAIEARDDVEEARKIIRDNLDDGLM